VGPHAVQWRGKGDRLAVAKKSPQFTCLTFNGGRWISELGGGFNLEAFLKEDVSGKEGHYNLRPHHS